MSVKLNTKYVTPFLNDNAYADIRSEVEAAHDELHNGTGKGNDFLGWLSLPENYDKEEFARIKKAAEKIRSDSDVLVDFDYQKDFFSLLKRHGELQKIG